MNKEISARELFENLPTLNTIVQKDLPVRVAIPLARNIKQFDEELAVVNDVRTKLLEKYAEKDEQNQFVLENQNFSIKPEFREVFEKEMLAILEAKKTYQIFHVKEDDLADSTLTISEIMALLALGILE